MDDGSSLGNTEIYTRGRGWTGRSIKLYPRKEVKVGYVQKVTEAMNKCRAL